MAENQQSSKEPRKVMMVKEILQKDNRPSSTNRIRPKPSATKTIEEKGDRFRARSRTPNNMAQTIDASEMKPKTLLSSKMSNTFDQTGGKGEVSTKGPLSNTLTSNMSVTRSRLGGVEKTDLPGPGSYNIKPSFPRGTNPVIQSKGKWDSLYGTKIAQNISPGPAMYTTRGPMGGTHQTIGERFEKVQLESKFTITSAGPGSYDTNSVNHLKR
jgi:hypothetical protein